MSLNLSWAKLSPALLKNLAQALVEHPNGLRFLNLSYNSLDFNEKKAESYREIYKEYQPYYDSYEFLVAFEEYLLKTNSLLHLDLSGLSFGDEQLLELCNGLVKVPTLLAVHLNDIGFSRNQEVLLQVLEFFGVSEKYANKVPDTNFRNKLTHNDSKLKEIIRNSYKVFD